MTGRQRGEDDAEGHGQPEAVDESREHVLRAVVRPQPVPCGRRGGCRAFDIEINGVVAVGDDWLDRPAAGGLDEIAHVRVCVVRLDGEFAAEFLFRRWIDHRHVQFPVHPQQDGFVIGDELREERDAEQRGEYPQGVPTAAVGPEIRPAATGDRAHPRASKSMRGSTRT